MPHLLTRQEPTRDRVAVQHADPDERGSAWVVDGLLVEGRDVFAERRRMMRERQTGRRDPAPVDDRPRTIRRRMPARPAERKRTGEMVINQSPLSQVSATGTAPLAVAPLPTNGAQVPVKERKPSPLKGRTKAVPQDVRKEIVYCHQCKAQLTEEQTISEEHDVVMTRFGGITTSTVHCRLHSETPIALATYFVVKAKSKSEAAGLS